MSNKIISEMLARGFSESFLIGLQYYLNNETNYTEINSKLRLTSVNLEKDNSQITLKSPKELYALKNALNDMWPNNRRPPAPLHCDADPSGR